MNASNKHLLSGTTSSKTQASTSEDVWVAGESVELLISRRESDSVSIVLFEVCQGHTIAHTSLDQIWFRGCCENVWNCQLAVMNTVQILIIHLYRHLLLRKSVISKKQHQLMSARHRDHDCGSIGMARYY